MKKEENKSLIVTVKNVNLQRFFSTAIIFIVAIITFFIGFFAIGETAYFTTVINFAGETSNIKFDNIFLNILYIILTLVILYFLYKKALPKINKKILLVLMLVFSLVLGFWWVNYIRLKPISDQSMVIYCAEKILDNDLKPILNPGEYLNRNPHQLRICCLFNGNI